MARTAAGRPTHPAPPALPAGLGVVARPAAPLRAFVDGYLPYLAPPRDSLHRGLPSGTITLVITLDVPVGFVDADDHRTTTFDALVGGLHTRPALMRWPSPQTGVQLGLTPLGSRRLLGLPAAALAHAVVPLAELWGQDGEALVERLRAAPHWRARFALLDDALLRRLDATTERRRPVPGELVRAWRRLEASHGAQRVDALAEDVGWSRRHLTQRFTDEIGLSPQAARRVLRFDAARRSAAAVVTGRITLADVAAGHGYADQAHLAREFRAFAGCSPSRWLAEEVDLPSVQDPAAVDAAR